MTKRYSLLLLLFSCINILSAQQVLREFPLPTEAFELRSLGQYEDACFFRHGDRPNYSLWRYSPAQDELSQLNATNTVMLAAEMGQAGLYFAEKGKDVQYEQAPIKLYLVKEGNPELISTVLAYGLEFVAVAEGHMLVRAQGLLYWLNESNATLTLIGAFNEILNEVVYWQNSFFWITGKRLYRADRQVGLVLIEETDWWLEGLNALDNGLIWQDSMHLYRYSIGESPRIIHEFPADDFREVDLQGAAALDGDQLFFAAPSEEEGVELWVTDGTSDGTQLLKDIGTATTSSNRPAGSYPGYFHESGGLMHFFVYESIDKLQYWTSDGTTAGTIRQEILTTNRGWRRAIPLQKLESGGYILVADHIDKGTEIIIFEGGIRSYDTNPGPGDSYTENLFQPNFALQLPSDDFAVSALSADHGREPYLLRANGEVWPLGDLSPGAAWSELTWLGEYDGALFLLAGNEDNGHYLYQLDPTQAVTLPPTENEGVDWIQTIRPSANFSSSFGFMYGTDLVAATDDAFFAGGAITSFTSRLRYAPDQPEERLDEGNFPCFVVKYQADGQPLWQLGLPGNAYTSDRPILATAPEGGVYAASRSTNDGFIRDFPFNPQLGSAYITRIDEYGSANWVRQFGLSGGYLYDMASDDEGNLLLSGWFENSLSFNGQRIEAAFGVAFFALSLDKEGGLRYLRALDATENWVSRGGARGTTFDAEGNAYLVLNSISKNYTVSCNYGNMPSTVVKLSPTGEVIWRREFLGNDAWYITDLGLSSRGNIFLTGKFRGQLEFDGRTISHEVEDCTMTGFIAKLDPNGRGRSVRVLEDGRRPDHMLTQADGTYVLSGYRALESWESYDGFSHLPFGRKRQQAFIAIYDEQDQLLAERQMLLQDEIEQGGFAKILPLDDQQYVFYTELEGTLDTFGVTSTLNPISSNLALVALQLPYEVTPLPTDGNVPRTALSVFPNPTADYVTLQTTDGDLRPEDMRLFNALGQEMAAPVTLFETGQYQLDLRQLPAGQYWLTSAQGDQLLSYPIVRVGRQ